MPIEFPKNLYSPQVAAKPQSSTQEKSLVELLKAQEIKETRLKSITSPYKATQRPIPVSHLNFIIEIIKTSRTTPL